MPGVGLLGLPVIGARVGGSEVLWHALAAALSWVLAESLAGWWLVVCKPVLCAVLARVQLLGM